jgi:Carboxypeptidase regulatory-like domain
MRALVLLLLLVVGNDSGSRFTVSEKRLPESFQGATITGTVVDAKTMQPVRGAIVTAPQSGDGKPGTARIGFRTGADGKFILRGVAPGIVNFRVFKAGYATGPISSVRPAVAGEQIDNVVLTVPPGASISGRILDEAGQPITSVSVTVRGVETTSVLGNGTRPNIAQPDGGIVTTDADGRYWIGGLSGGEYNVSVSFPGGLAPAILRINSNRDVVFNGFGRQMAASLQSATVKLDAAEEGTLDLVTRLPETEAVFGPAGEEPGTGLVSGLVVDPRGRGVSNATLTLVRGDPTALFKAVTDASGRFVFDNVPPGAFRLTTQKAGYMSVASPAREAPLHIESKTRIENLRLTLQRGGTISGFVTDQFGDPLAAAVMAISRETVVVDSPGLGSFNRGTATDARGRFRITGLNAGEYMVMASPTGAFTGAAAIHYRDDAGQERKMSIGPVFHPGVTSQTLASKIVVREDDELANVDFVVEPGTIATVNVTVTANQAIGDVQLQWTQLGQLIPMLAGGTKFAGSTKTLEVRPTRYRFVAFAEALDEKSTKLWASVDLEPDVDIPSSIQLVLEPAATLSGRIVFEGNDPDRQNTGPSLVATEPIGGLKIEGNSTFEPVTGRFTIEGVMPGRYALHAGGAERGRSPWMLKSAAIDRREVPDEPIELRPGQEITDLQLTVTDRVTVLSGTILDAAEKPAAAEWVLVFSTEKKHWSAGSRRLRAVRPDMASVYTVRALPPGTYFVTLLPQLISEEELIAKLPGLAVSATRVTIGEGERKVQDLRARR